MLQEVNDITYLNSLSDYKVSFNAFNKVLGYYLDNTLVAAHSYEPDKKVINLLKKLNKEFKVIIISNSSRKRLEKINSLFNVSYYF